MKYFFLTFIVFTISGCVSQKTPAHSVNKTVEPPPPLISEGKNTDVSLGEIAADTPPIKIALLVPLSGKSAAVGNAMFDAATLALYDSYLAVPSNRIRSKVILLPKDTGSTSRAAVNAAKQAIDQGAKFIIGPLFSQSVKAIKPFIQAEGISMLSFSNNKAVASSDSYIFGFLPEQQVERMADYAYLNKFQRVALLAPNDEYGEKIQETLSAAYLRKGGLLSPSEMYAPSQANIDAAVSRIAGAYNNTPEDRRFQAIFIANGGLQIHNIIKSFRKSNLDLNKIKLLGAGMWRDDSLTKIPELHGAWFSSSPPEKYKVFEKRFITSYGYKPIHLASLAYDAVSIITNIAMKNDRIDAERITNNAGFNTPAGGLVRLLKNGQSDRKLAIIEITPQGFKIRERASTSFSIQ